MEQVATRPLAVRVQSVLHGSAGAEHPPLPPPPEHCAAGGGVHEASRPRPAAGSHGGSGCHP